MTPIEKDKLVALCKKWGLKELNLTKGVYIADDNSGITMNLRGDNPIIGVTIAGELHTKGHGNLKVEDYQREVEAIIKSGSKKLQPIAPPAKVASLIASGEPETQGNKIADSHSAGATTTSKIKKHQKAKCKECNVEFEVTLDEARMIFEQYEGIYCVNCRKSKSEKTEAAVKHEKKEGDNMIMESKTKMCELCGMELSGARALECFQKDKPFMCEDCEEKSKIKGDKKMNEKLPTTINENENKLTVNVIKQYICPTATDAEAYNFLQLCVHRDLNPFLKEAYLIKYGTAPATMVVGKDAFTKKAEESGKLDGFEAGIIVLNKDKQVERRVGVVQYEGDTLIGGWAKVFRKDMKYPFVCEVPISEYMKYKDEKPQSSWATLPGTMIRKVALVQSLREAFTAELGGCYDKSEMGIEP